MIVEDTFQAHTEMILTPCYLTVGLSVLLHGLSAAPRVSRYAEWYQANADKHPPAIESAPTHEHRIRGLATFAHGPRTSQPDNGSPFREMDSPTGTEWSS